MRHYCVSSITLNHQRLPLPLLPSRITFQMRRPRNKKLQSELLSWADTAYEARDLSNERVGSTLVSALTESRKDLPFPPISTTRPP
jgi:hypothetical protein